MRNDVFVAGMAKVAAVFAEKGLPADLHAAYRDALDDLPDAIFLASITRCLRECRFLPRPVEIRERADELLSELAAGPPHPDAAWQEVLRALHHAALYQYASVARPWEWSHPAVAAACGALGGLRRLVATESATLQWLRRDFERVYGVTAHRQRLAEASLAGRGLHDALDRISHQLLEHGQRLPVPQRHGEEAP